MSHETSIQPIRLVDVKEAARILGCGRSTVYNLLNEGTLEGVKLRGALRFTAAEIGRYIQSLPKASTGKGKAAGGRADG